MARKAKGPITLTEAELVGRVTDRVGNGFSQRDVREVVKALKAEIVESVASGHKVTLSGLCKFTPSVKAGRKKGTVVRNPFDGSEKTLRADEPDKFVVKVGRSSALANAFPSLRSAAGKALHERLYVRAKRK